MAGVEEKKEIREMVMIFKSLDPLSRLLVQNSAKTLLARDRAAELRKETETVQQ